MTTQFSRRDFLSTSAGLTAMLTGAAPLILVGSGASADDKPALLGGSPMTRFSYPGWPIMQGDEEKLLLEVLHSGQWYRGGGTRLGAVTHFENEYAAMCGAKACIATSSGTSALVASLGALNIGPGDEVITSPYTFIATINSIIAHYALPVPIDVDLESFQLDGKLADAACNENTRCLLPVHIGGSPANMDDFLAVGKKRGIRVIEDACQAHLGEWRGKKLGTVGDAGCFSFQMTKNLCSGEGGAVLTNDEDLADKIYQCHDNCRTRTSEGSFDYSDSVVHAVNQRMTEFQAAILRARLHNIENYAKIREENGLYLNKLLADIPGVLPAKRYDGVTKNAWHIYMFRIDEKKFGINRDLFLTALNAEGIPCSGGYKAEDWITFVRKSYNFPAGKRVYPKSALDRWAKRVGPLPQFKKLCAQAAWFGQNMLLGPRENMDIIADAVRRIQKNADKIAQA